MRTAQLVQLVERRLDFGIYPGFSAIPGFRSANRDDIGKGSVGGHPETV